MNNKYQKLSPLIKFIKRYKLAAVCLLFFCASACVLFKRYDIDLNMMDYLSVSEDSLMSPFISIENGTINYTAYEADEPLRDSESGGTLQCNYGSVRFGVYQLEVKYATEYDTSISNTPVAVITLEEPGVEETNALHADVMPLYDYKSVASAPVWISSVVGSRNFRLNIDFSGCGSARIYSIRLYEHPLWKAGFLMMELLILTAICLYHYRFRFLNGKTKLKWLFFTGIVIFSSLPAIHSPYYAYGGHDYPFHIDRIASIANEIRYGHFPALYQSDVANGFGYAALLMYGNLFLYIPAFLHLMGLPLAACYNLFIILVNGGTCAIAYYSFRGIFKEKKYALIGVLLYMLAAYRLDDLYVRTALGEYLAMAFLPLVLYGFYRIYYKENVTFKDALPLILGISGIIESHILTVEMMIPFMILFAVLHGKITIKRSFLLIKAVITVIGLNLFFLLPFFDTYQQGLGISSRHYAHNLRPTGAYFSQLFSLFMGSANGASIQDGTLNELPLTLGGALVIGMVLFLIICVIRQSLSFSPQETIRYKRALECFLYGVLALWMSSIYFPWELFGYTDHLFGIIFTSIEYVWRYLAFATVFMTVVTVYALKTLETRRQRLIAVTAFSAVLIAGEFFTGYIQETYTVNSLSASGNLFSDVWYFPENMNPYILYDTSVHCDPENGAVVKKEGTTERADKLFYVQDTLTDTIVTFPVAYYDYLIAIDSNTGERLEVQKGYNQQLAVHLQKGYTGRITISYHVSASWKWAYLLSLITGFSLCSYCFFNRSGKKCKISEGNSDEQ